MENRIVSSPELHDIMILHGHWVAADSINYHLRRSEKLYHAENADKAIEIEFAFSTFRALSIWYSLLYVVVDGYRELKLTDNNIDSLLSQPDYLNNLRLFRNATFHYQQNPLSDKIMNFLTAKDSEIWINELNKALKTFFERKIPFDKILENAKSLLE